MTVARAAVTCAAASLLVPAARGDLLFTADSVTVDTEIGPIVVAEVDGQFGPDVIALQGEITDLVVVRNDGAGGVAGFDPLLGGLYTHAAAGDWDGDGRADIMGVDPDRIGLHLQVDDGIWAPVETRFEEDVPSAMALADVNGDGRVDLLVTYLVTGALDVFVNDGSGSILGIAPTTYALGDIVALECRDLDADGAPDVIAADENGDAVRVRYNDGTGVFGATVSHAFPGGEPSDVTCADVNGDGYLDFVVALPGTNAVAIRINDQGGGFLPTLPPFAGTDPRQVECADADCDGDLDVVVRDSDGAAGIGFLLNESTGTWTWMPSVIAAGPSIPILGFGVGEIDHVPGIDLAISTEPGLGLVTFVYNINPDCAECIDPPRNPTAWYTADGCTPDDLTGHHPGIMSGLPFCPFHWVVGGAALGFEPDAPTYATVASDCALEPGDDDFSMNAWVRTNAIDLQPIASKGGAPGYEFQISDGRARVIVCDDTFCWNIEGSSLIDDGAWHHVAFTMDRGPMTRVCLYVDGILEAETLATMGAIANPHDLLLGAQPSPAPAFFLDGEIDEMQIEPRVLSAQEIHAIVLAGIAGQCRDTCAVITDVEDPDLTDVTAGIADDFALPGEPATPGALLGAVCAGGVDFDVDPLGAGALCHTFDGLPTSIVAATLELRLRAGADATTCDDRVELQATGGTPAFAWSRLIGGTGAAACGAIEPGLLECPWETGRTRTICLDLDALPEPGGATSSVIGAMNDTGRLDLHVADGTIVDFARLRYAVDPCPQDLSGDGGVGFDDMLVVLSAPWGPCEAPCPPCVGDVNGDCEVGFADLLLVTSSWGPCR